MRIRVCEASELRPMSAVSVSTGEIRIAVFRTQDGALYALEDRCPHRGARLSEGVIYEDYVACRDHGWSICLRDGMVVAPDQGRSKSFPVTTSGGVIFVEA